ncbi:MAG: MBL fold metallo-hydrolase [Flavitalea sp.]
MSIALISITSLALLSTMLWAFLQQPQFGKAPRGERLELIRKSPHYGGGVFQNQSPTPAIAEGVSFFTVLKEFLFKKSKRLTPSVILPSQKANLMKLNPNEDILVWFGHSSYFLQLDGKKILIDPVLSGNASPLSFTTKSFRGADIYTPDEIPDIDYLLISHDHYDHLDYKTISALRKRVKKVITGIGVGAHLEHWGYDKNQIIEKDWNEEVILEDGFIVNTAPARHFSGRGFKRNGTLWLSFILRAPTRKIFIGGDSGYDHHFAAIGKQFGPFDLVILENGQYDKNWKYIHMMPEETIQAAIDLKAEILFPVHWSKFALSVHAWDDPIIRAVKESKIRDMPIMHPMIGEAVNLKDKAPSYAWWEQLS